MSEQSNLLDYENRERELAKVMFTYTSKISRLEFTPTCSYMRYDGVFYIGNKRCVFEIKVRDFPRLTYDEYILEVKKLKNLTHHYNNGYQVFYINIFKEDFDMYSAILFNLSRRIKNGFESDIIKKEMNEATFKNKYNKTEKDVIMISYDSTIDSLLPNFIYKENKPKKQNPNYSSEKLFDDDWIG